MSEIQNLITKLEVDYHFECEAGYLGNCQDWLTLKLRIKEFDQLRLDYQLLSDDYKQLQIDNERWKQEVQKRNVDHNKQIDVIDKYKAALEFYIQPETYYIDFKNMAGCDCC